MSSRSDIWPDGLKSVDMAVRVCQRHFLHAVGIYVMQISTNKLIFTKSTKLIEGYPFL